MFGIAFKRTVRTRGGRGGVVGSAILEAAQNCWEVSEGKTARVGWMIGGISFLFAERSVPALQTIFYVRDNLKSFISLAFYFVA